MWRLAEKANATLELFGKQIRMDNFYFFAGCWIRFAQTSIYLDEQNKISGIRLSHRKVIAFHCSISCGHQSVSHQRMLVDDLLVDGTCKSRQILGLEKDFRPQLVSCRWTQQGESNTKWLQDERTMSTLPENRTREAMRFLFVCFC